MKLHLLGTVGYHPNEKRHTLCLLLPECGVMLDAGTGMFRAAAHLQADTLDIFLTHTHLDHVVGLTYLFDVLYQHPLKRVTVHAEADKLTAIETHLLAPLLFPAAPPFDTRPLAGPLELCDGGRLSYFPLEHPGGVVGYRLDSLGRSMAYVTDTTARADAPYLDAIRGVDVLVHECYFRDDMAEWAVKTGHSWITAVVELARAARVGRLIVTHFNPLALEADPVGLPAARRIFPNTYLAEDGMVVEF